MAGWKDEPALYKGRNSPEKLDAAPRAAGIDKKKNINRKKAESIPDIPSTLNKENPEKDKQKIIRDFQNFTAMSENSFEGSFFQEIHEAVRSGLRTLYKCRKTALALSIESKVHKIITIKVIEALKSEWDISKPYSLDAFIVCPDFRLKGFISYNGYYNFLDSDCAPPLPEGFREVIIEYARNLAQDEADKEIKSHRQAC